MLLVGMRLVGWFGVRLSAPSLGLRLVLFWLTETKSKMCFSRSKNTFN